MREKRNCGRVEPCFDFWFQAWSSMKYEKRKEWSQCDRAWAQSAVSSSGAAVDESLIHIQKRLTSSSPSLKTYEWSVSRYISCWDVCFRSNIVKLFGASVHQIHYRPYQHCHLPSLVNWLLKINPHILMWASSGKEEGTHLCMYKRLAS